MVSNTDNAFIAGSSGRFIIDNRSLRQLRGTPWRKIDLRFFLLALLSILIHSALIYYTNKIEVKKVEVVIEEIPERFARLIIEKPIPKTEKKPQELLQVPQKRRSRQSRSPLRSNLLRLSVVHRLRNLFRQGQHG